MKKYNLKRFLASLLAVLMLASVTGVSPAVFAEGSATPELKASSGEVIIRSGMDDALVTETLNKALISNYDQLDDTTKASLQWEYKCDGTWAASTNTAWGAITGFTSERKVLGVKHTFSHPALKENSDGNYQVRLAGKTAEATLVKVDKYSGASIALTDYENGIKVPYNNDGSINYAQLKERILNKVVTNPVDVDRSSITIEYLASPDFSKFGENTVLDKITELAGTEWTPIEGGSHEFIGKPVPYFAMTAGENKIKLSWGGNDTYKGCSSDEFPVNFLDREPAPLQRNDVSEIGIVYNDDLNIDKIEVIKNILNILKTFDNISDNTVIAIGTPAHAGVYQAIAVSPETKNYEAGKGTGSLIILKNWKDVMLEKNPVLNSGDKANTINVSQAEALKGGNDLCILTKDGEALNSASAGSIHYWFTGVGKIYAKSTMPTAPGKYIVTATVRGGDFFAMPKTFVFTIVPDPAPEVTPET